MLASAIILIITGIFLVCTGIFYGTNLAIKLWWLQCQIIFHKELNKISYDIPLFHRWTIAVCLVVGMTSILLGIKMIP